MNELLRSFRVEYFGRDGQFCGDGVLCSWGFLSVLIEEEASSGKLCNMFFLFDGERFDVLCQWIMKLHDKR